MAGCQKGWCLIATERIQIVVTERGSRVVRRQIRGIAGDSRAASGGVNLLRTALLGLSGGLVVRNLVNTSDALTQVRNRLQLVSSSSEELNAVQNALFEASNRTRSAFEATAEVYARTALSARNLGVTQQDLIGFTQALNQSIILSGATAQEARNGLIQFSQGLASNRLAGDELRAVLEQLPLVADVIAQQLDVTRGSLRELAAQGKITARDILDAFDEDTQREIAEQFAQTIPTIAQSFTVLENAFQQFIGRFEQSSGVFERIARLILFVGDNFETVGRLLIAGTFTIAVVGAIAAVNALTAAIIANPIGIITGVVLTAVSALVAFSDQINIGVDSLTTLADLGVGIFQELAAGLAFLVPIAGAAFTFLGEKIFGVAGLAQRSFVDILRVVADFADNVAGVAVGLTRAVISSFTSIPDALADLFLQAFNNLDELIEGAIALFQTLGDSILTLLGGVQNSIRSSALAVRFALEGNADQAEALANNARDAIEVSFALATEGFGDRLKENFEAIDVPDLFEPVENQFAGSAAELGDRFGQEFLAGFESTDGVRRVLEGGLLRADARSLARTAGGRGDFDLNEGFANVGEPGRGLGEIALQRRIDQLTRQNQLLQSNIGLSSRTVDVRQEVLKIEEELIRKGVELTDAQRAQVTELLSQNAAYENQVEILNRLNGAQEQAAFELQQLTGLYEEGLISVAQFNREANNLRIEELASNIDVFSGFERGFLQLENQITDFASQAENTIVNAFGAAEDAIVEFVQTGEINFSSLVDSILADLTRLLVRQALFGLLNAAGGGFGGGFGAVGGVGGFLFGGGRQDGGPVRPDQAFLVGERGPELFVPPTSGEIVPNGGVAAPASPPVVNNIIVMDPNEVPAGISTPEGEEAVLNVIRRNPNAVREASAR